ncbi:MAG: hypothetical protein LBL91_01470 [Lachnospiraceae bacterium]|nr:hypothetical protein [Lachnospiraceae bacterium]
MLKDEKGLSFFGLILTIFIMLLLAGITIALAIDQFSDDPEPVEVNRMNTEVSNSVITNTDTPTENVIDNTTTNEIQNTTV